MSVVAVGILSALLGVAIGWLVSRRPPRGGAIDGRELAARMRARAARDASLHDDAEKRRALPLVDQIAEDVDRLRRAGKWLPILAVAWASGVRADPSPCTVTETEVICDRAFFAVFRADCDETREALVLERMWRADLRHDYEAALARVRTPEPEPTPIPAWPFYAGGAIGLALGAVATWAVIDAAR